MDLQGIKAIIFDLGGVILNIDYNLTKKAFEKLGVTNFDELYSQASQTTLFNDLEIGKISPKEFREELKRITKKKLEDSLIDKAWNAMLLDLPVERLELIELLKKEYKVFLLSNTNVIHIRSIDTYLDGAGIKNRFYEAFDKIYYSFELRKRKPNKDSFMEVLYENDLEANEVLFIDDSIQHINGAKSIGIKTLFLEKGVDITSKFRKP